ncbi:hypothetical protein IGI04_007802 [Brassica rapa subsp. trilocularis]|uniref:Reticulon-like protein n=1 Tax=Brassica rapa subsp. trilocularis TaxID=1813537 RepID=A0ABQ7NKS0_BRACM|nr:hypothetical protein IGI04_007802 [Brassica rapa subsp. trilocularis]
MSLVDQILGEGAVADLSVWENKITSGITLVMATLIWFLFEIKETEPVPFLCSILLLLILLLFIWVKRPPTPEELQQEDSPVRALFSEIEGLLLMLYEIAYGEDIKTFIWAILYVAIIYTIGSYINLLTIFYICLVCLLTIPVLYLQYQEVVDNFIGEGHEEEEEVVLGHVWIAMFGLKKPLERLSKHHKPSSSASASKSNPFDSVDESDGNKKHTLKPSNKISPQPSLPTTKKNHGFNPFDDVDDEEVVEKRLKPSFKNHFRESGGVENQTVQELESYAVYKSEETTKTVPGISSARDKISLSSKQGEKITRTHHKAVDIDHDLTRGEKLLGSLGGIFSRTWKPKKTRSITGPVITRGESRKRRVNNLETREKLGLNHLPKPDSRTNEPLPESADAYQKIEMEKAKQDDGLADLSDLLGELKNMAIDMGTEID